MFFALAAVVVIENDQRLAAQLGVALTTCTSPLKVASLSFSRTSSDAAWIFTG